MDKIEQIMSISMSFFEKYQFPIHPFLNIGLLKNLLNYIEEVVAKKEIRE